MSNTASDIKKGYLRNRPFMIIQRTYRPKEGQVTSKKDFGKTAQWEVFETASFHTKINNNQMNAADVIIDLLTRDVVKNRFEQSSSDVAEHYTAKYKEKVNQAVMVWMSQRKQEIQLPQLEGKSTEPPVVENVVPEETTTENKE